MESIHAKFESLRPVMDERSTRLWAGAEADAIRAFREVVSAVSRLNTLCAGRQFSDSVDAYKVEYNADVKVNNRMVNVKVSSSVGVFLDCLGTRVGERVMKEGKHYRWYPVRFIALRTKLRIDGREKETTREAANSARLLGPVRDPLAANAPRFALPE